MATKKDDKKVEKAKVKDKKKEVKFTEIIFEKE